jgi:DNA polymerase-3 subunit epsilon
MSWLTSPILALDTESTSTDPETARILTCCVGYSDRPGRWEPTTWRINPGVPIPPEATKVHGITDADVADWQQPADALAEIREALLRTAEAGVPVVLHNAPYDLTLLDREMRRHLGLELPAGLIILDTLVIFRRLDRSTGSRRLEDLAYREGIRFPAHDATEDALAALRLLHIMGSRNDLIGDVPAPVLHERQEQWHAHHQQAAHEKALGNGDRSRALEIDWPLRPYPTHAVA